MSEINLSKAVRSNLLSLQNTANLMAKTQGRLATGLKVNSALDNPTNFFTASALNSRAGDINQLLDGMANGIQTLEAADNGLKAITKTLESMQSTLRQARQDKSFQTGSFGLALPTALTGDESLSLTGGAVGTGSISLTTAAEAGEGGETTTPTTATATGTAGFEGTATTLEGTENLNGFDWSTLDDEDLTITVGGTTVTFSFAADVDDASEGAVWVDTALGQAGFISAAEDVFGAGVITVNSDDELEIAANADITVAAGQAAVNLFGAADDETPITQASSFDLSASLSGNLELSVGEESFTIDLDGRDSLEAVRDAINNFAGFSDVATASITYNNDGEGVLTIAAANAGESITFDTDGDSGAIVTTLGLSDAEATGGEEATGDVRAKTVNELVNEINKDFAGKLRASNDKGMLRIENLSTQDLTIGGVNAEGRIDGSEGADSNATVEGNSIRADLTRQYNELRDQLDKLADDASFNGINLLRGDNLKITFNEIDTSEIDIQSKEGRSINADNLKIRTNMDEADFDSDEAIDGFLTSIKSAINEVRSQASAFGSSLSIVQNRQDFSKNMINTLQTGAANLTLADTNEEAANLLALQTRQQLSSTALSMASQADQAVLRLF